MLSERECNTHSTREIFSVFMLDFYLNYFNNIFVFRHIHASCNDSTAAAALESRLKNRRSIWFQFIFCIYNINSENPDDDCCKCEPSEKKMGKSYIVIRFSHIARATLWSPTRWLAFSANSECSDIRVFNSTLISFSHCPIVGLLRYFFRYWKCF